MSFRPKIMVVEDDTALLHLLGEVLGRMGAEPRCLASSVYAAELIEKEKFDGVFLDWRMPEIDGLELARRIRRSRSNSKVPLVMLTGVEDAEALAKTFQVGINFFLRKPVSVPQLRHLLNVSRGLMLEERRRYQRAPVSLRMLCRWDTRQSYGQAVNLSASGVFLEMNDPPPLETRVTLEFDLPDQPETLECAGTVVRLVPGRGCAICFHYQRREQRLAVAAFVAKTLARLGASDDGEPELPH